uniref:Uncharacterized protein n=1 Tax=Romanomermis culicivorax TaxID=13658 RepID=A0A915II27_ROMCU
MLLLRPTNTAQSSAVPTTRKKVKGGNLSMNGSMPPPLEYKTHVDEKKSLAQIIGNDVPYNWTKEAIEKERI